MYEPFLKKLRESISLTAAQEEVVTKYLTPKKLRKRQYVLQEGDVAKSVVFVQKGLLRAYTVDDTGAEHITEFALEGEFITDLNSFLTGVPALVNIDAVEDCELVLITKAAHDEILRQLPHFTQFLLTETVAKYLALQKRLHSIMTLSLDERYENFVALFPELMQRVPQHMIASYMGLTPETVSRIRGRLKRR